MTLLNGQPVSPEPVPPRPVTTTASQDSQNVGFVMGLMALIFAFAFPLAGAIIGGIAVAQAKKGGYKNPLGLAGLILGVVFTVFWIVLTIVLIVLGVGIFGEILNLCTQNSSNCVA